MAAALAIIDNATVALVSLDQYDFQMHDSSMTATGQEAERHDVQSSDDDRVSN